MKTLLKKNSTIDSVMNRYPLFLEYNATCFDAAELMRDHKCGFLPITCSSRLVGVVTDRDIVMSVICSNEDPKEVLLSTVMNRDLVYAYPDDEVENIAWLMRLKRVHRVPVVARDLSLVGVISVSDFLANKDSPIHNIGVAVLDALSTEYKNSVALA